MGRQHAEHLTACRCAYGSLYPTGAPHVYDGLLPPSAYLAGLQPDYQMGVAGLDFGLHDAGAHTRWVADDLLLRVNLAGIWEHLPGELAQLLGCMGQLLAAAA